MATSYCIIASTGQGKTTLTKKLTEGKPLLVYDVNGEYPELTEDLNQSRSKFFGDPNKFIEIAQNKHAGTFVVFEEATGFLHGRSSEELRKFLIAKRHPVALGGRNPIFIFHTIQSVPPFILDMADYIILFKTGDDITAVKKKRAKLVRPFLQLQNAPKYSKIIIKNAS
jgi:ABC-type Na+ transport system ATPase subunit NatA